MTTNAKEKLGNAEETPKENLARMGERIKSVTKDQKRKPKVQMPCNLKYVHGKKTNSLYCVIW